MDAKSISPPYLIKRPRGSCYSSTRITVTYIIEFCNMTVQIKVHCIEIEITNLLKPNANEIQALLNLNNYHNQPMISTR